MRPKPPAEVAISLSDTLTQTKSFNEVEESRTLKLFVCVKVSGSDIETATSAGGFGLTNRQLLSSNSVSFFYFLLLETQ